MSSLRNVDDNNFEQEVLKSERPVLVDFGAAWCGPCRRLEPLLEKLATERDDVDIVQVDIDAAPNLAATYQVRGVPTLILFDGGEAKNRAVGLQPPAALNALLDG